MSPRASTAAWRRPRSRAGLVLAAKLLLATLAVVLVSQYLAGYLFLWWIRASPREATPLTVTRYAYYYGERDRVSRRLVICSAAGLMLVGAGALLALWPKGRALHGNARFARRGEIAAAGLFAKRGIFLGRVGRKYLILGGQQGAIVSAPPRSDKGTAIVVPNCLYWQGSLICQDIKLENWRLTAGYRATLGPVFLVNPLDPAGNTACCNPLAYVPADPNLRISGIQRIAATLFPEVPGTDPFWTAGGRGMFLGLSLYVLETPSLPPTLGEVLRQGMASDAEGFSAHWKRIIGGRQRGKYPLSAECVRAISDIMDLAPVTASSIRKTFTSRLDLFANPLIDAATSRNDFDWRDLRRKSMSVYLGIQPADLALLRPLLNLFVEQAIALQTDELPEHNPQLREQVLILLDETTAPGRIPVLAQAISYLPGYNVRLLLVIQAYSQLRDVYGPNQADTMMKSLAARVLYAPKDYAEANEISQELGNTTVRVKSLSQPRMTFFSGRGPAAGNVSLSEQRRPLLLPQEVKELGRDRELLLYEGLRPVLANKNRYFEDGLFRRRLRSPPRRAAPSSVAPRPVGPRAPAGDPYVVAEPGAGARQRVRKADIPPETGAGYSEENQLSFGGMEVDFSRVVLPEKPEGERLTTEELDVAVEGFLNALRER